jgi:anti-sigma factor RsiW
MGNVLQQLENNEAVLLMYLSGELASEDRTEVEQMLGSDAKLRAELAQLREAQDTVNRNLAKLDEIAPLPASVDVALRQVARVMQQRQLDKLMVKPKAAKPRRHVPWWVYTTASAAAAIFAVIVWWGLQSDVVVQNNTTVASSVDDTKLDDEQESLLEKTMGTADESGNIAEAENQAQILVAEKGQSDQPPSLSILSTDEQSQ